MSRSATIDQNGDEPEEAAIGDVIAICRGMRWTSKFGDLSSFSPTTSLSLEILQQLLEFSDENGWTALHWAAAYDRVGIVRLLYHTYYAKMRQGGLSDQETSLKLKEFLHSLTKFRDTPLHIAAYNASVKCISWLIDHGANLHVS